MKRVIASIRAGLGNQLFQYATAFAVARRLDAELLLDPSWLEREKFRPYGLDHFALSGRRTTPREQAAIERRIRWTVPVSSHFFERHAKRLARGLLRKRFRFHLDRNRGDQQEIFSAAATVYLAGTWASPTYFAHLRQELLREFTIQGSPSDACAATLAQIRSCTSLCVHVRRGDYVSDPGTQADFGTCTLDYYARAFALLQPRLAAPHAFVFSDDPDWTREHLRLACPTTYVTHNAGLPAAEDLRLMAACRHFIIANSTFSWWGAWLAQHPGKQVVAPARWSNNPAMICDPVPPEWLRA